MCSICNNTAIMYGYGSITKGPYMDLLIVTRFFFYKRNKNLHLKNIIVESRSISKLYHLRLQKATSYTLQVSFRTNLIIHLKYRAKLLIFFSLKYSVTN